MFVRRSRTSAEEASARRAVVSAAATGAATPDKCKRDRASPCDSKLRCASSGSGGGGLVVEEVQGAIHECV